MFSDNDEFCPAVLLLHGGLPRGFTSTKGRQHAMAPRIVGVRQPEHSVLGVAETGFTIRLDSVFRDLGVSKLSFVRNADGMEEFDLSGLANGEADFHESMGCLREVDGDEQAAVGFIDCATHDEYRSPGPAKKSINGLTQEEGADVPRPRSAPDQEVGTSRLGEDVVDGECDPMCGADVDAMTLTELQGVMGEPAGRVGRRRLSRIGDGEELERRPLLRAKMRRA